MRIPRTTRRALAASLFLPAFTVLCAQCPDCAPDLTCEVDPPYPTLCPLQPPDATAGVFYEADITFWLPVEFVDPGTGFNVQFEQMLITNISGLPFGLNIEPNDPQGLYFPQQDQYGCARICGTPLGAGTYTVNISILATVNFQGITINAPEQFGITLVVQPGEGGNAGFSFAPNSGCGSVEASFTALIDGGDLPTEHAWDFGNGNTGTGAQPPPQLYDEPGTYPVELSTTLNALVLQQVVLSGVNDNWCGDIEEPNIPLIGCVGAPDLYFVLTDANGGTVTSNTFDNVFNATWDGLGLVLDNPPYNIAFWDEDFISQDDHLGTFNIPQGAQGTIPFNVAGGTFGTLLITLEPQDTFVFTDSVVVFPEPVPLLVHDELNDSLCVSGEDLVAYVWFLNGDTLTDAAAPCLGPTAPGMWWVQVTNGFGCTGTSEPVVICPEVEIAINGDVLFTDAGYATYAWTYNGAPVPGGDGPFIFAQGDGTYTVAITTTYGCTGTATLDFAVGIPGALAAPVRVSLFPVPSDGHFTLLADGLAGTHVELRVLDATGRTVAQERIAVQAGELRHPLHVQAAPGRYFVELLHAAGRSVVPIVLH